MPATPLWVLMSLSLVACAACYCLVLLWLVYHDTAHVNNARIISESCILQPRIFNLILCRSRANAPVMNTAYVQNCVVDASVLNRHAYT
ncbi:hypothetical protein V1507DRAFT_464055 [Lipomyces tetrasporus]